MIMSGEELLSRYAAGERDFSGLDLSDTSDKFFVTAVLLPCDCQ